MRRLLAVAVLAIALVERQMLPLFDLIALIVTIVALSLYHCILYSSVCFVGDSWSQLSTNIKNSHYWMMKHSEQSDTPTTTLAVQTFRNTIVVSVFVAGISLQRASSVISDYNTLESDVERIRAIIISILLFSSFLSWACVIRLASHMGFMVGTFYQIKKEVQAKREEQVRITSAKEEEEEEGEGKGQLGANHQSISSDKESLGSLSEKLERSMEKHFEMSSKMLRQMFSYFQ